MSSPPPLLSLEHLSIRFSTPQGMAQAVHDISFIVHPGDIYALVGESGCGKSSAAHAVMRLI